ncbi:MAG: OadG family protein [Candidatus Caldatribacteriota bacterium]|nr:OadG family protein [Candidatus Caldatribacteriota bacterium]
MFEGIKGALQLAVIDMILVFIILSGLALVMVLLKNIVTAKPVKSPKETKIISPAVSSVPKIQDEEIESELIAVITAAITSCLATPRSEFKIVNIKKYKPLIITPWSAAGRQEAMLGKNIKY